jgi:hypothetical protein
MAASEDEKTQKNGMVAILVNIGKNRATRSFGTSVRKIAELLSFLPCRFGAVHFCVDDPAASTQLISMAIFVLGSHRVGARVRLHKGELCEW